MERIPRAAQALGLRWPRRFGRKITKVVVWTSLAALQLGSIQSSLAAQLTSASASLSDSRPSQSGVTQTFTVSGVTASVVQCVRIVWANASTGNTAPSGFSGASGTVTAGSSTLINSSASGWSLAKSDGASSTGQNNIYEYTNSTGVTPSTTTGATFVIGGLVNPNLADTAHYVYLNTFGNTDCSTSPIDNATMEFINTNGSTLSLTVDPTLTFTVNGVSSGSSCVGDTTNAATTSTTLPFGNVVSGTPSLLCQDLAASTNATGGYSIYMRYTGAPSNGTETINPVSGSNAAPAAFPSPGTEAYGYSTTDASLGTGTANRFTASGPNWAALTTSNAEIAYESGPVATTNYDIAHQVDVSLTTPSGTYVTTVIYTCTPVF
jgi:hypothetical protein